MAPRLVACQLQVNMKRLHLQRHAGGAPATRTASVEFVRHREQGTGNKNWRYQRDSRDARLHRARLPCAETSIERTLEAVEDDPLGLVPRLLAHRVLPPHHRRQPCSCRELIGLLLQVNRALFKVWQGSFRGLSSLFQGSFAAPSIAESIIFSPKRMSEESLP